MEQQEVYSLIDNGTLHVAQVAGRPVHICLSRDERLVILVSALTAEAVEQFVCSAGGLGSFSYEDWCRLLDELIKAQIPSPDALTVANTLKNRAEELRKARDQARYARDSLVQQLTRLGLAHETEIKGTDVVISIGWRNADRFTEMLCGVKQ